MSTQRPLSVTLAVIFLVVLGIGSLSTIFEAAAGATPSFVPFLDVPLGVLGWIAAYGLWRLQRWGGLLAIVVCILDIFQAMQGVLHNAGFAQLSPGFAVIVACATLIVLLLPDSRRVYVRR